MKHTPGPWKTAGHGNGRGELPIRANGKTIAIIRDAGRLADAHLIDARPDLLAALQAMLEVNDKRKHPLGAPDEGIGYDAAQAISKARAAIAKATR